MLRTQRAQRRPRQVHQPKLQHQCVLSDHCNRHAATARNRVLKSASTVWNGVFAADRAVAARGRLRWCGSCAWTDGEDLCSFAKANSRGRTPYGFRS